MEDWTKQDEMELAHLVFVGGGIEQIARFLGRTIYSCQNKVAELEEESLRVTDPTCYVPSSSQKTVCISLLASRDTTTRFVGKKRVVIPGIQKSTKSSIKVYAREHKDLVIFSATETLDAFSSPVMDSLMWSFSLLLETSSGKFPTLEFMVPESYVDPLFLAETKERYGVYIYLSPTQGIQGSINVELTGFDRDLLRKCFRAIILRFRKSAFRK